MLLSDGHIYNLETKALSDLTDGAGEFVGILGTSSDLSHVYFIDDAVLTGAEENAQGAKAEPGADNLYLSPAAPPNTSPPSPPKMKHLVSVEGVWPPATGRPRRRTAPPR